MAQNPAPVPVGIAASALLLLAPTLAAATAPERDVTTTTVLTTAAASPGGAVPRGTAAETPRWGAAYVAEGIGVRLSVGFGHRAEARRDAEARCLRDAAECRPVGEFAGRCGAVARAVDRSVLAATRPLTPASVGAPVLGGGATEAEATRDALRACAAGRPGGAGAAAGLCLVLTVACGPR